MGVLKKDQSEEGVFLIITSEEFKATGTYSHINHCPASTQISIHAYTKDLFTSVPIPQYRTTHIQHKTTRHAKSQEKKYEEIKQTSVPDSDMTPILELLEREYKVTMNYTLSAPIEILYPY